MKDHKPSPEAAKDRRPKDGRDHDARAASARQLDRRMRWAQLWLLKFARYILQIAGAWAPLERAVDNALAPQIKKLAKLILLIIALKAAARVKTPRKERSFGPQRRRGASRRVLIGVRLRRLVRARDLRAKIAALLALAHDAESHIARAARRLAYGLTRAGGGVPRAAFVAQALCFTAASLDAANTS